MYPTHKQMEKRNITAVLSEIEQVATIDINIALSCFYVLFQSDGKPFTGISVRFAEIIASSWGNINTGAKVVRNDGVNITVMGFVEDLEKNSRFSVELQRRVVDRNGSPLSAEQVTLATTTTSSVAFRNAIFKAVPAAIFTTVVKKIKAYIKENVDGSSILNETLEFFRKKGVQDSDIKKRLNVLSLDNLNSDDLFLLIGLKNALNEGDATIVQIFGYKAKDKKPSRPSRFQFDKNGNAPKAPVPVVEEVIVDDKKDSGDVKQVLSAMSQPLENNSEAEEETEKIEEEKEEVQLITRPRGRTPKGMKWDGVKGEYVPIEDTST